MDDMERPVAPSVDRGDAADFAAVERWFVRRGLPHAIEDYSVTEDVLTRSTPFFLGVLVIEVVATFSDRFEGWAQFGVLVAAGAVVVAAFAALNRLRGRHAFTLPDDVGVPELAAFVAVPAVLPLLFTDQGAPRAIAIATFNLIAIGVAYVVTSYGLLPALRTGFLQAIGQFRSVVQLVARGLPLLLLITALVFLNAEVWQVAYEMPGSYFAITLSVLVGLALGFLALRLPRQIEQLAKFSDWSAVDDRVRRSGAPAMPAADPRPATPGPAELTRRDRINIGIVLTASQVVQVLLIGLITTAFYVGFGLIAIGPETYLAWTTADEVDVLASGPFLGSEVVLTAEHLMVAAFVGAFAALQFSVASVTDTTYREEFSDEVVGDVRDVLAVRCVYRTAVAARGRS